MQEEDWGKYSQASWMTGGAWKDRNHPAGSKRSKAKRPAQAPTTKHARDFSEDDKSIQDEEKFRAQVDEADLKMKLRRWNFARSWRPACSSPLADESDNISPRSRPEDVGNSATFHRKAPLIADQAEKKNRTEHDDVAALSCGRVNTVAKPNAPLDNYLTGQYLDRCVAATESQLAGKRNKTKKKEAVKEIERLVEKVVRDAGRSSEREGLTSRY
ncbi:MAG: hypothetical protein Q9175_006088 [Cornicularia normoerica]